MLVNDAGSYDGGPIEDQSLDDLREVIEVHPSAFLDMCRLASSVGSVINVASIYVVVASRGPTAADNATKGAIVNLTRELAAHWEFMAAPRGYRLRDPIQPTNRRKRGPVRARADE